MPELPEIEVARETLTPCVVGKTISGVLVEREKSIRTPLEDGRAFAVNLNRRRIKSIERWGKALVFRLDDDLAVVFHFKLGAVAQCHSHTVAQTTGVAWNFSDGSSLDFTDLVLSEFHLVHGSELAHLPVLKQGADPLDPALTAARLKELLAPRKQVKAALMEQEVISGIGNNYADEILWNARLSPFRRVGELTSEKFEELAHQINATLQEGIESGGEPGFQDAQGRHGHYPTKVHHRGGKPCPRDGHPIEAVKKGRTTYWCPQCQV